MKSLKWLIVILVYSVAVTKPAETLAPMYGTGSLMIFLFLQEEARLWRAALVICKLNVVFTQHHFWARSVAEAQCNTPSSQRKSSLWLSGAVCGTWVSQLPELVGDHKNDKKNKSGYLGHLNREGQFLHAWSVYHGFTLLFSLLLQHFTSFYLITFLKMRPSLTTHLWEAF